MMWGWPMMAFGGIGLIPAILSLLILSIVWQQ